VAFATDFCAQLAKEASFQNAKGCLESFPFNPARHQAMATTMLSALQFHVFMDISKNSPDKAFQPDYDIEKAVTEWKGTTFPNDMAAQEALHSAFIKLNDAHSSYDPLCYRKITYVQHFFPTAIPDKATGKTRVYVGGLPEPVNPADANYLGREILEIDGKPSFVTLWAYAQASIGRYKDASARFDDALANMAYDTKGKWVLNAGSWASRSRMPPTDSVTFKFAAGKGLPEETVTRRWHIVLPKEKVSTAQGYWDMFCKPGAAGNKHLESEGVGGTAKAAGEKPAFLATPRPQDNEDVLHNKRTDPDRALLSTFVLAVDKKQLPAPLIKHDGLSFFEHPKNKSIGILSISTFSIEGEKAKWRQTMAQIIQRFINDKKQKLIIDLTGNGGGYLDLAWETIAVLTPNRNAPFPMIAKRFKRDFRLSPLHAMMVTAAHDTKNTKSSMNPSYFGELASMKGYHGTHLVKPGRARPDIGGTVQYSQLFQELPVNPEGNPLKTLSFNLKHDDMVVLSSGDCGSACGMVFLHLREVDGVRGAALGYVANRPRMVSTFPVTEVFTLKQLLRELDMLKLQNDPKAPKALPVSAVYRFPIREGYSQRKGLEGRPEEYLWSGADILIDNDPWLMLRPDRVWMRLAAMLGWHKSKWVKATIPFSVDPARPFGTTPTDNLQTDATKLLGYTGPKGLDINPGTIGAVIQDVR
jgi:hypothetical protein